MRCSLYLVRHAIAAERGPAWPDDRLRPLTPEGEARFHEAAEGLVGIRELDVQQILTSPLTRARQTAAILASVSSKHPRLTAAPALAPGELAPAVWSRIRRQIRRSRVALVGHEPALGELAAYVIGASRPIPFKKGGVCRIDLPEISLRPDGTLVWMIPPRLARRLRP